jgi:hypothetical protein
MAKQTLVKIKFLKSPTGSFGLAYSKNDETEIEQELAETLVLSGFAQYTKTQKVTIQ